MGDGGESGKIILIERTSLRTYGGHLGGRPDLKLQSVEALEKQAFRIGHP